MGAAAKTARLASRSMACSSAGVSGRKCVMSRCASSMVFFAEACHTCGPSTLGGQAGGRESH